jgi:acetylornithine deacetylase/succinyl-diaminopimelate desuccinylase-like protein
MRMQLLPAAIRLRRLALLGLLSLACINAVAQSVHYEPVSRAVIESRLGQYRGNDRQRANTLKQLFSGAGCDEQHLSEQSVKGSKLPNVICVLPGSSGKVIIVGAHYDHVSEGDGVVDNWSGASVCAVPLPGGKK